MRYVKNILFVLFGVLLLSPFFFLPVKEVLSFTETRTEFKRVFYVPLNKERTFEMRYIHSIHLTDVFEFYEVTKDRKIRMVSMSYENLSIGMPGEAAEGETIDLKDGIYTLTYKNREIDSFRIHIGRVDADLALRYNGVEVDLKEHLVKGKSYEFKIQKLSLYQLVKGEKLHGERQQKSRRDRE